MAKGSITAEHILAKLEKKEYKPIYFLQGEEAFFIDLISSYIEKEVLDESERDFNQVILYGKEAEPKQIIDHARQFPMMAPYRVIIIREAQEMRDLSQLASYMKKPSDQTILVLNYKYKKLDLRTALAKSIQENGIIFTAARMYEDQVPPWVVQRAKKYNLIISTEAATLITEFLGPDLSKIDKELDKLSMILGRDHKVTLDEVKEHIGQSKDYNIFELNNAIGAKNIVKANRIIQYFAFNPKSTHITAVLTSLYGFFSKVLIVQENYSQNDMALAGLAGVHHFFIRDYRQAAKLYSREKLYAIFDILASYDLKCKGIGNKSFSNDELMKELVFKILH